MRIRTLLLVAVLVAMAMFVALNWSAIMTPTTLSLGVAAVQAPLGVLLLGLLALFMVLFLVSVIYSKASGFFVERQHTQEMQATQELADDAETSRFTELREMIGIEFKRQAEIYAASTATVLARLEQLNDVPIFAMKEPGHALAAPARSVQYGMKKGQS